MSNQQTIGDSPGVYGRFNDQSAYPTEPAKSIGAFVVEAERGRRGLYKAISPEDYLAEYGHNPRKSLTSYGPLLTLQETNRCVIKRGLRFAMNAGAIVAVVPHEDDTPDGTAGQTIFRPFVVGETNDDKDLRLSDDMAFAFFDLSPGKSPLRINLKPEMNDPEGGFWVEVFRSGIAQPIERFQVSLTYRNDGQGGQMYIEQRINKQSSKIRVVVNTATQFEMTDDLIDHEMSVWLNAGDAGEKLGGDDVIDSLKTLADPERIRYSTLGLTGWENATVQRAGIALCQARKDAFAVMDVPRSMQGVDAAITYRTQTLRADSSYGALYSKYVVIADPYVNMDVAIPLSAVACGLYAYTDREFRASFSPAGRRRGDLQRFMIVGVDGEPYSLPDREKLCAAQINPIKTLDEVGSFIWNDNTLQRRNSMLSFIGVSRNRNAMYVAITDTLDNYVFDPNDSFLRDAIDTSCRDILKVEQRNRSISRFTTTFSEKLNTPRASDAGKLFYQVIYTPVNSARQIVVDYTITNSSVDITQSVV